MDETAKRPTVLVVDDSPDNVFLLGNLLKDLCRVKVAINGERALQIATSDDPPDLILLDVMMQGMNGYEVCRRLKADAATHDIPVIFLTALSTSEDEKIGLDLGAVDYITKPINPAIVLARTRNHLALKALHSSEMAHMAEIEREKEALELEQLRTEKLMLNILPRPIAERLRRGEKNISSSYPEVTILFSDLIGFTQFASQCSPTDLVKLLNDLFTRFDRRAENLGLEKIKTIGDAYMAAGGLPVPRSDHAQICADMALGMFEDLREFNAQFGLSMGMRVGLHSGPVVAGVIGFTKFSYDLWGHTVNVASRMESTAPAGRVQVSASSRALLGNEFKYEPSGEVECKGIGPVMAFLLAGRDAPA